MENTKIEIEEREVWNISSEVLGVCRQCWERENVGVYLLLILPHIRCSVYAIRFMASFLICALWPSKEAIFKGPDLGCTTWHSLGLCLYLPHNFLLPLGFHFGDWWLRFLLCLHSGWQNFSGCELGPRIIPVLKECRAGNKWAKVTLPPQFQAGRRSPLHWSHSYSSQAQER